MADLATNLDLIAVNQAQKEVIVNELLDAASTSTHFGRHGSACSALTWGYYGGVYPIAGVPTAIANGTISLTASASNYLYVTTSGVVTKVTSAPSGWPGPLASGNIALYLVTTDASGVTNYVDYRVGAAIASGSAVTGVSNSDGTLTISPTSGAVVASLNLGHANTWTAAQTWRAGTTAAGTAPMYFQSGPLLTTAVAGAVEFLTDKAYFTITTGAARKEFTLNDAALTSGRVPYVTTNGRLADSAILTYDGLKLTIATTDVGEVSVKATNSSTGAAAYAAFVLNNSSGNVAELTLSSTGYSTSGVLGANTCNLYTAAAGALNLITASAQPINLCTNGYATTNVRLSADSAGNVSIGNAAIATTATDGFLYLTACAGPPTGVPTAKTGRIPIVVDSTNNKVYVRSGGSWVALN